MRKSLAKITIAILLTLVAGLGTAFVFLNNEKNTRHEYLANELTIKQNLIASQGEEIKSLTRDIGSLKQANNDLSMQLEEYIQPEKLYLKGEIALSDKNWEEAANLLWEVKNKYPCSEYAQSATEKILEANKGLEEAKKRAQAEVAAQREGFKQIKPSLAFSTQKTSVRIKSSKKANQWITDRHGNYWIYYEADKDADYYILDVDIASKEKSPSLPAFYVGVVNDSGIITNLMRMEYNFYRWENYGTYLGNYEDFRNDFEKKDTVSFTVGAQLKKDQTKGKTVIIFSDKEECFERSRKNFGRPPVMYHSSCISPGANITAKDFIENYVAVRIF